MKVAEVIASITETEWQRAAKAERSHKYKKFYNSRAWRAARYAYLKTLRRPLRCKCCGATAADTKLCVDHIRPIRKAWQRRLDASNMQLLCTDCNLAKASSDQTDWRPGADVASSPSTVREESCHTHG